MTGTSKFMETFIFLTKLAWNCRMTLPMLVTAAFMAMDVRLQIEINVRTERIPGVKYTTVLLLKVVTD